MSQRLDIFRGKERCGQCKSKRFFLQDGLTFCQNGHQQEVATQVEVAEDVHRVARKTRKKREIAENVSRGMLISPFNALNLLTYTSKCIVVLVPGSSSYKRTSSFFGNNAIPSFIPLVYPQDWRLWLKIFGLCVCSF